MKYVTSFLFMLIVPIVAFGGATVKIHYENTTVAGRGTGNVIANEGELSYILTCNHVCPDDNVAWIEYQGKQYRGVHVVANEVEHDLALCVVKAKLPVANIASYDPIPKTSAEHNGFPGGNNVRYKTYATIGYDNYKMKAGFIGYHLDIDCYGGESGSGVYIKGTNTLFAVISQATRNGLHYTYAIGTTDVRNFLRSHSVLTPSLKDSLKLDTHANQSYNDGVAEAKDTGKPLVTFVGVEAIPVDGCVTCAPQTLKGYDRGTILISWFDGDSHQGYVYKGDPKDSKAILQLVRKKCNESSARMGLLYQSSIPMLSWLVVFSGQAQCSKRATLIHALKTNGMNCTI
jgi:hypothetical protein